MILTSNAKYEIPINAWVAKATGDVVCPICGNYIKDVEEIILDEQRNAVWIQAPYHSRVMSKSWLIAEDLAMLCSIECLDMHNTLGGSIYAS